MAKMNSADLKRATQIAQRMQTQAEANNNAAQWLEAATLWRVAKDEARAEYCEMKAAEC